MSEGPEKQEKTEDATDKKLNEAVERGDVPVSQEATMAATLAAFLLSIVFIVPPYGANAALSLVIFLEDPAGWRLQRGSDAVELARAGLSIAAAFLLPTVAVISLFTLCGSGVQSPPRLISSRIRFDWKRVSVSSGIARLIGQRGWTQFGKALIKLAIVAGAISISVNSQYGRIVQSISSDPGDLGVRILDQTTRVTAAVLAAVLGLAAADLAWARYHWRREQRMSRQEVKDELRQMEGDPMLKARVRSIRMARSRKRMLASVPKATLVIANPTHFAVALRYVRHEDAAPVVVAKGADFVALKIREIADEHGVAIIEDKSLARSLYQAVSVDDCIPAEFYRIIAELIHFVEEKRQGRAPVPRRKTWT